MNTANSKVLSFVLMLLAWAPASSAEPSANETKSCKSAQFQVSRDRNRFGHHALKVKVQIDAPANLVWEAIRDNRAADPDVQYSKLTHVSESERILEQKYVAIPIFGSTTCFLKLEEERNRRIDYCLLRSDRLREFEGSWVLTPSDDNSTTTLELSNHLKLNLPVPQRLIDAFAEPKMKARISFVKQLAESNRKLHIASSN